MQAFSYGWESFLSLLGKAGVALDLPEPTGEYHVVSKDFHLNGLFVHVYFPVKDPPETSRDHRWIHSYDIIDGYGRFFNLSKGYSYALSASAQIALPHIRLPSKTSPSSLSPTDQTFPLIIFSHGLASWGTAYSMLCSELSSRGYVVAAVDHQDGSASSARRPGDTPLLYTNAPPYSSPENWKFRNSQLKQRSEEVQKALEGILRESDTLSLPIDRTKAAVIGHSFGGGTALYALLDAPEGTFDCGVVLDGWAEPFDKQKDVKPLLRPVLCLHCDSGRLSSSEYWQNNLRAMESNFLSVNATIEYIEGSEHTDISDPAILFSGTSELKRKWQVLRGQRSHSASPRKVLEMNVERIVVFLQKHL